MVTTTCTVENNCFDACRLSFFGNNLAELNSAFVVCLYRGILTTDGGSIGNSVAFHIIYALCIDVLVREVNGKARALFSALDLLPDAPAAACVIFF